jgi:hypothetical protein
MDISKIPKKIPDYNKLFEKLSRKNFLIKIFVSPRFARTYAFFWASAIENKIKMLNQVFTYYNEDDLYKYFEINHLLHKDKSKYDYIFTLFHLITDLHRYSSEDNFSKLEDVYFSDPIYIYRESSAIEPEKYNLIRDLVYYGQAPRDIRDKFKYNSKNFKKLLKKIYQEELLPLDITSA